MGWGGAMCVVCMVWDVYGVGWGMNDVRCVWCVCGVCMVIYGGGGGGVSDAIARSVTKLFCFSFTGDKIARLPCLCVYHIR